MTTGNKTTAPEGATSETANELANGSVTTAYLSRRGHNTGSTYGTWVEALQQQIDAKVDAILDQGWQPMIVTELLDQAANILVEDAEHLLTHLDLTSL